MSSLVGTANIAHDRGATSWRLTCPCPLGRQRWLKLYDFWEPFSGRSIGHKKQSINARMFFFCACFSDIRHANANTAIRASEVTGTCRRLAQEINRNDVDYFDSLDSLRICFLHLALVFLATGPWFLVLGCVRARVINYTL